MKRIWVLLALVLSLAALPVTAFADEAEQTPALTKQEQIIRSTRQSYVRSLYSAGKESFAGFCGLMTSHQLYNMGINKVLVVKDGNKQYDYYSTLGMTDAGYHIAAYPATEFSLEEALNHVSRNGTRDVYNMIVGFQWTNTEAGGRYGHACVINAIIDGTVYFVESFYTSLGGNEGNVIQCSIAEFAWLFDGWTSYEGLIHFGDYSILCEEYEGDVFLRTRFTTTLRSQPCVIGSGGCQRLRNVSAGELLYGTAVIKDPRGQLFYRVSDGARTGYVAATAVITAQLGQQGLSTVDLSLPETMAEGEDPTVSGTVSAACGAVGSVEICISDPVGVIVLRERVETQGKTASLDILNEPLYLDLLETGVYRVEVYADAAAAVVQEGRLQNRYQRVLLASRQLQVGQAEEESLELPKEKPLEGWLQRDGNWYCYRRGKAVTGWVSYWGVEYYLDDTGAAVTGWQEIEGWRRYFSATGAMCTGWLTEPEGTYYLSEDGTAVTGWWEKFGKKYYFDEQGLLQTKGEIQDGETVYVIAPDGTATEKSTEQDKKH